MRARKGEERKKGNVLYTQEKDWSIAKNSEMKRGRGRWGCRHCKMGFD